VASGATPLMAAQSRKRRRNLFLMQATESVRGAGDEAVAAAGRRASGRKGEGMHGLRGQSAATQTAPKFGPCLRRRGQVAKNALGRWAGFFPASVKIGPIRASAVCLCWAVGDTLAS
jgi:type II secretory pathway pseudopilin PulG